MNDLQKERNDSLQQLTKPWVKFFAKFSEIETLDIKDWSHIHILGYFDKKFKEAFNKNYSYSFRGAPSKCTEIFFVKKIFASLNTNKASLVKDYIDWIFDCKIKNGSVKIRSISFFVTQGFGNEFLDHYRKVNKPTRSKEIPQEFKNVVDEFGFKINTFGDLAFAKMMLTSNNNQKEKYQEFFDRLVILGFRYVDLDGII